MKGQYRILMEVLIFAIGVAIASFVFLSFEDIKETVGEVTVKSQLTSISKMISSAIIKSVAGNSTIKMQIPEQISDFVYAISVVDAGGTNCDSGDDCSIKVFILENPEISVSQQLFNISQNYIIKGNVISTSGYIEISFDENLGIVNIERFG